MAKLIIFIVCFCWNWRRDVNLFCQFYILVVSYYYRAIQYNNITIYTLKNDQRWRCAQRCIRWNQIVKISADIGSVLSVITCLSSQFKFSTGQTLVGYASFTSDNCSLFAVDAEEPVWNPGTQSCAPQSGATQYLDSALWLQWTESGHHASSPVLWVKIRPKNTAPIHCPSTQPPLSALHSAAL